MTNFEKIKNMSVEELSELFSRTVQFCHYCPIKEYCLIDIRADSCASEWEQWLKSEVEND